MEIAAYDSSKISKLLYNINIISALAMSSWISWPYLRVNTGVLFFLIQFGIWFFTTDLVWVIKRVSADIIFILIFFFTFIPYIAFGSLNYGTYGSKAIIVNFPIFFVGIFINQYYMYYKKDYNALGKIAIVSLIMYTIGSVQTYAGLIKYPLAARILGTGEGLYEAEKAIFTQMGIGTFGHINSSCFLCIAMLYLFLKKRNNIRPAFKIIAMISSLIIFLMILKASFAITILIFFTGFILVLLVKNRKAFFATIFLLAILLLIIPNEIIGKFLLDIASIFGTDSVIYEKLSDLAVGFLGESMGEQTGYRLKLYLTSLLTFLKQPLFGINGPFGNPYDSIGMHSGWLDFIAFFGLFSGIPLFMTIYNNFKKNLIYFKGNSFCGYIIVVQFLFLIFGLINPNLFVYEIGFVTFCIIPSIPFINYCIKDRKHKRVNDINT